MIPFISFFTTDYTDFHRCHAGAEQDNNQPDSASKKFTFLIGLTG